MSMMISSPEHWKDRVAPRHPELVAGNKTNSYINSRASFVVNKSNSKYPNKNTRIPCHLVNLCIY